MSCLVRPCCGSWKPGGACSTSTSITRASFATSVISVFGRCQTGKFLSLPIPSHCYLPHTLLQLEMQAAAASMTLKPPPPYVCPGTAGREKVCDHCNPNVPINRDLNAAKNMEKIFLAYLKTRERPEHLRWPSYKPANTCDAASDGPLPVVAPQAASRPPTGTASAPSPAAPSATQARARGKATPKRPAGSEQTTISSAAGQSKRVKQVGRGR